MPLSDFKYLINLENPNHIKRKVIVRIFLGIKNETNTGYVEIRYV